MVWDLEFTFENYSPAEDHEVTIVFKLKLVTVVISSREMLAFSRTESTLSYSDEYQEILFTNEIVNFWIS